MNNAKQSGDFSCFKYFVKNYINCWYNIGYSTEGSHGNKCEHCGIWNVVIGKPASLVRKRSFLRRQSSDANWNMKMLTICYLFNFQLERA